MSEPIIFTVDGSEISAQKGQTILEAADQAGIYIPRLCYHKKLSPGGHCRVCTVLVNGRPQSACTHPVGPGMTVQNNTPELQNWRKSIVEMLFVEGNHYCMFCEKSGNCELQGVAYRLGIIVPRHSYLYPIRHLDATHPDVLIERNRCILCGRCVRASRDQDKKGVFGFVQRGHHTHLAVNAEARLKDTNLKVTDLAAEVCPVGSIIKKRVGFAIPIGKRLYDHKPIGSDIEERGR